MKCKRCAMPLLGQCLFGLLDKIGIGLRHLIHRACMNRSSSSHDVASIGRIHGSIMPTSSSV